MGYTKLGLHKGTGHIGTGTVCVCECVCVFNSIKKTLIIPQGAILLSWQAHNLFIFLNMKLIEQFQQTQHHQQKSYFNQCIVINIEQL